MPMSYAEYATELNLYCLELWWVRSARVNRLLLRSPGNELPPPPKPGIRSDRHTRGQPACVAS